MDKHKKCRILCFHGYRQSATTFREKTGGLRKAFKKEIDFEFVSAPHAIELNGENVEYSLEDEPPKAWWFSKPERTFSSRDVTKIADGFDESVRHVEAFIKEKGPFDGFLGFSQGAAMTHLLVALKQLNIGLKVDGPRFIVVFSAFKSLSSAHAELTEAQLHGVPSFHVYGLTDEIVDATRSQELASTFERAVVLSHPGRHCIPPVNLFKTELKNFLSANHLLKR